MPLSIHWTDIGFIAEAEVHTHHVDFKVYRATADGKKITDDADNEEVYMRGFVKWDGCSNWNTDDPDKGMMRHFCERKQLVDFGEVMARCWDTTSKLLPIWDALNSE